VDWRRPPVFALEWAGVGIRHQTALFAGVSLTMSRVLGRKLQYTTTETKCPACHGWEVYSQR
jgi:beta-xylosidase